MSSSAGGAGRYQDYDDGDTQRPTEELITETTKTIRDVVTRINKLDIPDPLPSDKTTMLNGVSTIQAQLQDLLNKLQRRAKREDSHQKDLLNNLIQSIGNSSYRLDAIKHKAQNLQSPDVVVDESHQDLLIDMPMGGLAPVGLQAQVEQVNSHGANVDRDFRALFSDITDGHRQQIAGFSDLIRFATQMAGRQSAGIALIEDNVETSDQHVANAGVEVAGVIKRAKLKSSCRMYTILVSSIIILVLVLVLIA